MTGRPSPIAGTVFPILLAAGVLAGCSLTGAGASPDGKSVATAARPAPAPVIDAPNPSLSAAGLLGAAPEQLTVLLGEPEWRWTQGPASLWQYRSEACVLDIFMLAGEAVAGSPDQPAPVVVHVEARPRQPDIVPTAQGFAAGRCADAPISAFRVAGQRELAPGAPSPA